MPGRSSRKPRALLRGMKVYDYHSGEEMFMKDPTTRIQYGNFVSREMFDTLTDTERQDQIDGMINSSGRDYSYNLGE